MGAPGANAVNFTMYLSDLKDFDETREVVTVYAIMSIEWEDLRWANASQQKVGDISCEGCERSAGNLTRIVPYTTPIVSGSTGLSEA